MKRQCCNHLLVRPPLLLLLPLGMKRIRRILDERRPRISAVLAQIGAKLLLSPGLRLQLLSPVTSPVSVLCFISSCHLLTGVLLRHFFSVLLFEDSAPLEDKGLGSTPEHTPEAGPSR